MATSNLSPTHQIVEAFVESLARTLSTSSTTSALIDLIEAGESDKSGYLRDLLVFSPKLSSRHGVTAIQTYLDAHWAEPIAGRSIQSTFRLVQAHGYPTEAKVGGRRTVKFYFDFETERAFCRAYAMLPLDEPHKAMAITFMNRDWKGHEEQVNESDYVSGDVWRERRRSVQLEEELGPEVIVVGAGQAGLQCATRLKRMGFRVLVLEKDARIGDLWRYRYPTLTLHATKRYCELLYMPYPATYPEFLPGSLLGDWLEMYAKLMDLTVWTSSTVVPNTASYDPDAKRWQLNVSHNGVPVVLRPKHLVWATGQHGIPRAPQLPGSESSNIIHSSQFTGASSFSPSSKVLIVGAATSALDIAYTLTLAGVHVTILQRSATAVVSLEWMRTANGNAFPEGVPIEELDERVASLPVGMSLANSNRAPQLAMDKDLLEGLNDVGFKINDGPKGSGQNGVLYERFSGFYVDVGCAGMVIEGKVKLEHGSVKQIRGDDVELDSGKVVEADQIILATGFYPLATTIAATLGEKCAKLLDPIWGLDSNGEIRVGYGASGCPGLSVAVGTFPQGRFYSKYLGLYLRGLEEGYITQNHQVVLGEIQE